MQVKEHLQRPKSFDKISKDDASKQKNTYLTKDMDQLKAKDKRDADAPEILKLDESTVNKIGKCKASL